MFMPDTQSFIIMYILSGNYNIVCIGYHPSPSKTSPSLFCQASHTAALNLHTAQAPFLGNPLALYWFFVNPSPPPPKNQIFQSTQNS